MLSSMILDQTMHPTYHHPRSRRTPALAMECSIYSEKLIDSNTNEMSPELVKRLFYKCVRNERKIEQAYQLEPREQQQPDRSPYLLPNMPPCPLNQSFSMSAVEPPTCGQTPYISHPYSHPHSSYLTGAPSAQQQQSYLHTQLLSEAAHTNGSLPAGFRRENDEGEHGIAGVFSEVSDSDDDFGEDSDVENQTDDKEVQEGADITSSRSSAQGKEDFVPWSSGSWCSVEYSREGTGMLSDSTKNKCNPVMHGVDTSSITRSHVAQSTSCSTSSSTSSNFSSYTNSNGFPAPSTSALAAGTEAFQGGNEQQIGGKRKLQGGGIEPCRKTCVVDNEEAVVSCAELSTENGHRYIFDRQKSSRGRDEKILDCGEGHGAAIGGGDRVVSNGGATHAGTEDSTSSQLGLLRELFKSTKQATSTSSSKMSESNVGGSSSSSEVVATNQRTDVEGSSTGEGSATDQVCGRALSSEVVSRGPVMVSESSSHSRTSTTSSSREDHSMVLESMEVTSTDEVNGNSVELTVKSSCVSSCAVSPSGSVGGFSSSSSSSLLVKSARTLSGEVSRQLVESGKLALILDLDNTILHTLAQAKLGLELETEDFVDKKGQPELYKFSLPSNRQSQYFLKLRPGLREMLVHLEPFFELSIYTNATKEYTNVVLDTIDPDNKLFGNRVIARDFESQREQKKEIEKYVQYSCMMTPLLLTLLLILVYYYICVYSFSVVGSFHNVDLLTDVDSSCLQLIHPHAYTHRIEVLHTVTLLVSIQRSTQQSPWAQHRHHRHISIHPTQYALSIAPYIR
eukprot:GHVQ01034040.1.p1 GENE.GHVQ01034040.1~~GHVQ01034040.1.p1  ORF type:complete len:793 (+),score=134.49 GHVQ01034040.1:308-2686(+)